MKPFGPLLLVLAVLASAASGQDAPPAPVPIELPKIDIDGSVDDLLAQLSLEDKAGQMTQLTIGALSRAAATAQDPDGHRIDEEKLRHALVEKGLGSIINMDGAAFSAKHWQTLITTIQEIATAETAHKIPVLYGIDHVHGANYIHEATLFPHATGLAATRNLELAEMAAAVCARETRAVGIPWTFAPVLDVGRQPLWSRFYSTFGEDVHLCSAFGEAMVRGLQGSGISAPDRVAACGKHFIGYSFPFSGRDRTQVLVPERYLREYFLPPFWDAIDNTGLKTIMVNSSEINGIPVHANHSILTKLLRGQIGFEGVVVSDWEDIKKLHDYHRVAPTMKEAVRLAVDAGIDLCMVPYDFSFTDLLVELVNEGAIREEVLDESVRRILRLKYELGLFEDPFPAADAVEIIGNVEAGELSLRAARESLVLLKNDGALPIGPETRILLTGPGCDLRSPLHGPWSYTWQGRDEEAYPRSIPTLLHAFQAAHGRENVRFVPGTTYDGIIDLERAANAAHAADVIVCVLAEEPGAEQAGNIDDLALPAAQARLVRAVSFGKPLVLVLLGNRPRIITESDSLANAVLWAGYPGPKGGQAVYEALRGIFNPSGKLPFTYPRAPHNLVAYDHKFSDTADRHFGFNGFNPLYEFGHGLSYTTFESGNLVVPVTELTLADTLEFSIDVANTGAREGSETVEVFVRDLYASITPPVKRLRDFRKITLAPGESRTLTFRIPVSDLSFHNQQNMPVVEPGEFELQVAGQSAKFTVL
ncbi:MAG: beta-glucosidase [Akkermansiaceae bacterium]|nr:beta-glucosidase [Akkermansiaceae bacterium]